MYTCFALPCKSSDHSSVSGKTPDGYHARLNASMSIRTANRLESGRQPALIRRAAHLMALPTLHQSARPLSTLPTLYFPPVSAYRTEISDWDAVIQWFCSGGFICKWWLGEQCFHDASRGHFRRVRFEERIVVEGGVDGKEGHGSPNGG